MKKLQFICPECCGVLELNDFVYVDEDETNVDYKIHGCKHCVEDKDNRYYKKMTVEEFTMYTSFLIVKDN